MPLCRCGCGQAVTGRKKYVNKDHQQNYMKGQAPAQPGWFARAWNRLDVWCAPAGGALVVTAVIGVLGLILTAVGVVIAVVAWRNPVQPAPGPKEPEQTELVLAQEDFGYTADKRAVITFNLTNRGSKGVADVRTIAVEVLDVLDDPAPAAVGVLVIPYTKELKLHPKSSGKLNAFTGHKIPPNDLDRFVLGLFSEPGHDYFFRLVVDWHDPLTGQNKTATSHIFVAQFPAGPITGLTFNQQGQLIEKQQARIDAKLKELKNR